LLIGQGHLGSKRRLKRLTSKPKNKGVSYKYKYEIEEVIIMCAKELKDTPKFLYDEILHAQKFDNLKLSEDEKSLKVEMEKLNSKHQCKME